MTQQTITALFDKRSDATQAIDQLVKAGIPRASIKLMPDTASTSTTAARTSYDASRDEKGFWASLGDFFMPEEDRYTYAEAMHRGGIMVTVTVDEAHAARAEDILEEHGTVNIDEREASWRKEGWSGYSAASDATTAKPTGKATGREEVIPVVEEQLNIGKRQVGGGHVRVRSYVVETPVNEQVNLHSETVRVERRPADRAVAAGDEAFRDRTIDAQSTSEEAVVSKTSRVTGEVVVNRDVQDRTETVQDKVRRTEVEVEDDRATKTSTGTADPRRKAL